MASAVAQLAKLMPGALTPEACWFRSCQLGLQLPAQAPGKAELSDPACQLQGSWLWSGPAPATVTNCRVRQQMEDVFLPVPSVSLTAFQIKRKEEKREGRREGKAGGKWESSLPQAVLFAFQGAVGGQA